MKGLRNNGCRHTREAKVGVKAILGMSDSALKTLADSLPPLSEEELRRAAENVHDAIEAMPTAGEAERNLNEFLREMS